MKDMVTNRAFSKARNHSVKPQRKGASATTAKRTDKKPQPRPRPPESCGPEASKPPKNLKTVIEYEFDGVAKTANTLYWGGRWPDDFFLGNRFTTEPPRKTDLADIMDWMANLDELGSFYDVDAVPQGGEVPWHVLFHALSLELRLHAPAFAPWSNTAPWFAKSDDSEN